MPQKKNPDPLEMIRSKTALVIGNLTSIMTILKSLPSGYSRDLQDTKIPFWNSIDIVALSLEIVNDIIASLTVKKDIMSRASNTSYAISLDIAEVLVMKYNIPFRIAHKLVGALVNKSVSNKDKIPFKSLSGTDIKEILEKMKVSIDPDKLMQIVKGTHPQRSIKARRSEGSIDPKQQIKVIKIHKLQLEKYMSDAQKKKKSIDSTKENLTNAIYRIIIKSNSKP
jgi:argininosuccinate lyase